MGIVDDVKEEIKEEMKEVNNDRGILDIITEKAISRKLLVWMAATVLLCMNKLTPEEWTGVSLGYIGIEGVADIASKWRRG